MIIALIAVIFILFVIFMWWFLGVYNVDYPGPARPDANFGALIAEFQSYPKELWFRFNPCKFDEYLLCSSTRFVVFESNGRVVYDSYKRDEWSRWDSYEYDSAKQLTSSYEYITACTRTRGTAIRGKVDNLAELVKIGDRYRIVHLSRYVYDRTDSVY